MMKMEVVVGGSRGAARIRAGSSLLFIPLKLEYLVLGR